MKKELLGMILRARTGLWGLRGAFGIVAVEPGKDSGFPSHASNEGSGFVQWVSSRVGKSAGVDFEFFTRHLFPVWREGE